MQLCCTAALSPSPLNRISPLTPRRYFISIRCTRGLNLPQQTGWYHPSTGYTITKVFVSLPASCHLLKAKVLFIPALVKQFTDLQPIPPAFPTPPSPRGQVLPWTGFCIQLHHSKLGATKLMPRIQETLVQCKMLSHPTFAGNLPSPVVCSTSG